VDLGGAAAFVDDGDAVGAGHGDVGDAVAYAAAEVRAARVVLDCHVADGARLAVDGEDQVEVTALVAEGAGAGERVRSVAVMVRPPGRAVSPSSIARDAGIRGCGGGAVWIRARSPL
jgi:hypothetical protein